MTASKLSFRFLLVLPLLFLLTSASDAQYRASLRGTVIDAQAGAVVGATATSRSGDTSANWLAPATETGVYQSTGLPPAPYRVTVEHPGFKKKVLEHVQIIPEQPNALDLPLEVGDVQQTVTVSE